MKHVLYSCSFASALLVSATAAMAQRPPQPGQGGGGLSIERAFEWLAARPGVIVALVVMVAAIAYMVISGRKSKT